MSEEQTPLNAAADVATEGAAAPTAAPAVEPTVADLEAALRQAEARTREHEEAWLRAKAETENVRRRAQDEIDKARKFALEKFATELLAVKDSLEAALKVDDSATLESVKSCVDLTLKQLVSVFDKHQISAVDPLGQKFDPNLHQAIGMVDGEGEPNSVATVLQKGYLLNERVIRPALVMVLKGQ